MSTKNSISTILIIALLTYCAAVSARFIQADPLGLEADINPYAYVRNNPLRYADPSGLTIEDLNFILLQVRSQFPEVQPTGTINLMGPVLNAIYGNKVEGVTNPFTGTMYMPSTFGAQKCLSRPEWEAAFFQSVFHEGMHSTDPSYKFLSEANHTGIYNRVSFEQVYGRNVPAPRPMWGTPRTTKVDKDELYRQYKNNSPDCLCGR